MKKIARIGFGLLYLCSGVVFAKTYTPQQLNSMVNSGNHPKQGSPSSQSKPANFDQCKATAQEITGAVSDNYPVRQILNTSSGYIVKVWTNDAALTITCSKPDQKMVITQSNYE